MRVLKNNVYFVYISPAFENAGAIIYCGCYMKFLPNRSSAKKSIFSQYIVFCFPGQYQGDFNRDGFKYYILYCTITITDNIYVGVKSTFTTSMNEVVCTGSENIFVLYLII